MIVYWSMFVIPAMLAMLLLASDRRGPAAGVVLMLAGIFLIMAFRETGGDFPTYLLFIKTIQNQDLGYVLARTEPLYGLLNYLSVQLGFGIYGVNTVCAAIFLYAFYRFVRLEPYPTFSLALAAAYLIIVVAIGYSRQGVAIGLLMWATVYLREKKLVPYCILLACALGFHTSAAIGIPLIYFGLRIRYVQVRVLVSAVLGLIAVLAVLSNFGNALDRYMIGYVGTDHYSSTGAAYRIGLSVAAAVVFLALRHRLAAADRTIWTAVAIFTLLLVPMLAYSSTIVDRIGLYTIPLQLVTFGRLPALFPSRAARSLVTLGILGTYGASLAIWMFVGNFAKVLWLPYQSLLFGTIA